VNGSLFRSEIREQPAALERLLERRGAFGAVADAIAARRPDALRLVGHGSSDNAASYGVYVFGLLPGWTAFRDSISLATYYEADVDVSRSVVLALSQSGRTPDVLEYVRRARARGAFTVALTNDPRSELGRAADAVLPLEAGPEESVAATKTYTNQLAALALLAGATAGRGDEIAEALGETASLLAATIPELESAAAAIAVPFAFVGRMFVVGRGLEFATAREVALKLTETCRVAAEPLTATDLAHGPIAALDPLFPVWTIASATRACPPRSTPPRVRARRARRSSPAAAQRPRSRARHTRFPSRTRRTSCSPPSSRSFPVSSLRPRSRTRKGSTPTGRTG
jgi:glucosamine--fructose-6-phosphate aminotransferase (isomerizing)